MAGIIWPGLQFVALSPLTAWSIVQATRVICEGWVGHRLLIIIYAGLASLLLYTQWLLVDTIRARIYEDKLGCKPVKFYPFPRKYAANTMKKALKEHRVMDVLKERLDTIGHTYLDYGPGGTAVIVTDEPENVKTIQSTKFDDWEIGGTRKRSSTYNFGRRSILANNGAKWRAARELIKPAFVRNQIADLAALDRHVSLFLENIPKDGSTIDLQPLILMLTMDSSTDFIFGSSTNMLTEASPSAQQFIDAFEYVLYTNSQNAYTGLLGPILPDRKLTSARRVMAEWIQQYAEQARAATKTKKRERNYVFVDALLESGADEEDIIDQLRGLIFAGRDAMAVTLTALFWFLARNPDVVAKIREEIACLGEPGEHPSWTQVRGLRCLNNAIKETLRLLPPVPVNSRMANKDTILPLGGGPEGKDPVYVRKGSMCRWVLYSLQRRKDLYGEDADVFRPERWDKLDIDAWDWLPFQGGPRRCIGEQFAMTNISYFAYRILQKFSAIEARDDDEWLLRLRGPSVLLHKGCRVGMIPA